MAGIANFAVDKNPKNERNYLYYYLYSSSNASDAFSIPSSSGNNE